MNPTTALSISQMYDDHAEKLRLTWVAAIGIDRKLALTEPELMAHAHGLAAKNKPLACFAGAGAQDSLGDDRGSCGLRLTNDVCVLRSL